MTTVAIVSGGIDSTTMLWQLKAQGHDVKALSFDYGQRHRCELDAALFLCDLAGVPHDIVDLRDLTRFIARGSQTGNEPVPEGHYAEESMKATVVPNRNMIMLSVAIAHAITLRADAVAYGAHGGDHAIYPDCRPAFVEALGVLAQLADWHPVRVDAPYLYMTKAQVVKLGASLCVPFGSTWSCYVGGMVHCGRCGTCVERREAFELAGVPDPTEYVPA